MANDLVERATEWMEACAMLTTLNGLNRQDVIALIRDQAREIAELRQRVEAQDESLGIQLDCLHQADLEIRELRQRERALRSLMERADEDCRESNMGEGVVFVSELRVIFPDAIPDKATTETKAMEGER
jgi:hypothetical protein